MDTLKIRLAQNYHRLSDGFATPSETVPKPFSFGLSETVRNRSETGSKPWRNQSETIEDP